MSNTELIESTMRRYNFGKFELINDLAWHHLVLHIEELFSDIPGFSVKRYRDDERIYIYFGKLRWIVLSIDVDKLLVISSECIEVGIYDKYWFDKKTSLWINSAIRKYLNKKFLKSFSTYERSKIAFTMCENKDFLRDCLEIRELGFKPFKGCRFTPNDSANTIDRVFLPSVYEYFFYLQEKKCFADSFWLRSLGLELDCTAYVNNKGNLIDCGDWPKLMHGIRPTMWITSIAGKYLSSNPVRTFAPSLRQTYLCSVEFKTEAEKLENERQAKMEAEMRAKALSLAQTYFQKYGNKNGEKDE